MGETQSDREVPRDQVIVLFGATGDLAKRKLLPGMFHLAQVGLMPERFRIVGAARTSLGEDDFRELARESVASSSRDRSASEAWARFSESLRFPCVGAGLGDIERAVGHAREEPGRHPGLPTSPPLP